MSVIRIAKPDIKTIELQDVEIAEEYDQDAENMILLGIRSPNFVSERKKFMQYPDDSFYIYFDMFISVILLISCMITPLNFAFSSELESI